MTAGRERTCPTCAATWSRRARFCGRCGSALAGRAGPRKRTARLAAPWGRIPAVLSGVSVAVAVVVAAAGLPQRPATESEVGLPPAEDVPEPTDHVIEPLRDGPVCRGRPEPISCVRWLAEVARQDRADVLLHTGGLAVATVGGTITVHDRQTGLARWSSTVGPEPQLWPSVAGTVPVTATVATGTRRTVFLTSERGTEVGAFDGVVDDAAVHGPWLLVVGDGELAARAVSGNLAWARDVGDEEVWLTPGGAHVSPRRGELALLNSNTGNARWQLVLSGPVLDVVRAGGHSVVATGGARPAVVTVDRQGGIVGVVELENPVRWLTTDVTGSTVAAVTEDRTGARLHVLDGVSGARRAVVHLGEGVTSTASAAVGEGLVAVTHSGATPAVTVADSSDGQLLLHRSVERFPADVAVPRSDTVVVTDARGAWSWSVDSGHLRWRVQLGQAPHLVAERPLMVTAEQGVVALDAAPGVAPSVTPRVAPGVATGVAPGGGAAGGATGDVADEPSVRHAVRRRSS